MLALGGDHIVSGERAEAGRNAAPGAFAPRAASEREASYFGAIWMELATLWPSRSW